MRLIIVRHGETEENVKEVMQGQTHGKLTKSGIIQHKKLAKRLKNEKIDLIYSSDLGRTKHLAKEILNYHKVPVHYAKELRERKFGIFEGKSKKYIIKHEKEIGTNWNEFKPKKGESPDDMQIRTEKFYKKIISKYKNTNKTILFVTHAGFITHLLLYILGLDRT